MKAIKYPYLHRVLSLTVGMTLLFLASLLQAQTDPGPRPVATATATTTNPKFTTFSFTRTTEPADALGNTGAGNIIANSGNLGGFWGQSIALFGATAIVPGGANNTTGLGPAYNAEGCQQCHSFPTIGGSSGHTNPQATTIPHDFGASNPENLSAFITASGPVREVRFINDLTTGLPDGGVHELFSIQGRSDAPTGCQLQQPDFATALANNNAIFRIPTPTFGLGFVENTPEATLTANLANAQALGAAVPAPLGPITITGHFNTNGNDGTITRFGWKAQNKSLLLFSGEASNVELGATNELFQTEKVPGFACATNPLPEDVTVTLSATDPVFDPPINPSLVTAKSANDIETFAVFMRLNGAPGECAFNSKSGQCFSLTNVGSGGQTSQAAVNSIQRGKAIFGTLIAPAAVGTGVTTTSGSTTVTLTQVGIGCVLCHSDVLSTGPSTTPGLNNQPFSPFSDFAVHQMDASLADGITQGSAGPNEFRTAPLWGIGQRLFFLHDGRVKDLLTAITDHAPTAASGCTTTSGEACQTIVNFLSLPPTTPAGTTTPSQQDVLNFLRSL